MRALQEFIDNTPSYRLLDLGNGKKLEKFGEVVLIRPDPNAKGDPVHPSKEWRKVADGEFLEKGNGKGYWNTFREFDDPWLMEFPVQNDQLVMECSLTKFKHVGVFPEQQPNWEFIHDHLKGSEGPSPKVLNLFAYTGAASIVSKLAGGDVFHVEALKQLITWARKNMEHSGTFDIRWVKEDAFKFVKREVKRGNLYKTIILDPPPFGRGPKGETWVLKDKLDELLGNCLELLDPKEHLLILDLYAGDVGKEDVLSMARSRYKGSAQEIFVKDLSIKASSGKELPTGSSLVIHKSSSRKG